MKKLRDVDCFIRKRGKKLLMSGNSLLLFLLLTFNIQAGVLSQTVSLKLKDVTLKECFREIERQTNLGFLFNSKDISGIDHITITSENENVETVLREILEGTNLEYKIEHNVILIVRAAEKTTEPAPQEKRKIMGRVTDDTGATVPGVNVIFKPKGSKEFAGGTVTDANGNFTLDIPAGPGILSFSFVGYETNEVQITNQSLLNVTLKTAVKDLEQVVVTGIFTRKSDTYTGSTTSVKTEELQKFGNRNLITSLRNIDPSFNIVESTTFGSDPNRLPEIQIRGNSSVPNVTQLQDQTRVGLNTPLIILDGFETTLKKLLDINENEVESMTILKDASATAIYGSRGANGVVVIQTKAPMAGKLRITYRGDMNIEAPDLTAYSLLNARDKLDLEWKVGLYNNARAESDVPLKRYYNYLQNEVNRGVNTDWMAIPLRLGIGQRHNLRLEGGDQTFRYSASVQDNNIQGVMKGSFRNTFNGTVNLAYTYKSVKFINQLAIGFGSTQNSPYGDFSDYVKQNPYWRPYDANGNVLKFLGDPGTTDYSGRWNPLPTNPLYNATLKGFDKTSSSEIINNFSIEWTIRKDLLFRSRIGITRNIDQSDRFRSADNTAFANYSADMILRKGDYLYGITNGFSYDGSLNLSYNKVIAEKHQIFAGFDYNMRQNKFSTYSYLAEGFTNANFDFPSMALQYAQGGKPGGAESLTRAVGITANLNYTYNNRYYLDASVREDGSSQFGAKQRFAPFWSAGIGWNLHQENFLKDSRIVNRLKLRGSMGITGSQNFYSYQALSTYQYYTDDRYYTWMGSYLLGLGNESLRWQQKMNYDAGVEAYLFNQLLAITFDYYTSTTKDLVSSINLPPSNGFSSYVENIGSMQNKGFEAKATIWPYRNPGKGIFWSVTGFVFQNRNKITSISQAMVDASAAINKAGGSNPNIQYQKGYSSNAIWVVPSLGIDPSTGKELFLDRNGNPTYTWSSLDLKACGVSDPKYQGSFSTMFRYKTLSANVSFGYRYGGQLYNYTLINKVENADYKYNVDSRVYDNRWQKPGDIAGFKGLSVTTVTQMTSRFVQDEKTLTCQNINVQYDLKSQYLKKNVGLELITFSSNMADLFYISTVKRERGTLYPFSHNISFSINAMF